MFALTPSDLAGRRVLDCSAGASSFAAEAADVGCDAIAVDPAYALGRRRLAELGQDDLDRGTAIAEQNADRFTWAWYGDKALRTDMRRNALAKCLADLQAHPQRYVAGALPRLPFVDDAFDVAVCSHLLFTWAEVLDRGWHHAALRELSRVARQLRIFPTIMQGRGEPVPFWAGLMDDLTAAGLQPEIRRVPYEFQVGGNRMLVLTRVNASPVPC